MKRIIKALAYGSVLGTTTFSIWFTLMYYKKPVMCFAEPLQTIRIIELILFCFGFIYVFVDIVGKG